MNKRLISQTMFALAVVLSSWDSHAASEKDEVFEQLDLLVDVRHEIVREYVDDLDADEMTEAAVRAMIDTLDDQYTVYLSHDELEDFDAQVRGSFSGIGAEVYMRNGQLQIVSPLEDSPAWNAGVMVGDIVLEIDDVAMVEIVQDMRTDNEKLRTAIKRLTGEAGTKVKLLVRHESGEEQTIEITRDVIDVPTLRGVHRDAEGRWDYMLDAINQIGYIRISQFTDKTVEDLKAALDQLQENQARGLILDLRFNPGGLLEAARGVCDLFLPGGKKIVSIKGRNVPERVIRATRRDTIDSLALVVLANEYSASASEIVAGALSENGQAKFIGTRTFGKGSVQQVKKLGDIGGKQGAIKITNAYYYLPNGRNIHRKKDSDTWGVDPEDGFYIPMTIEQTTQMIKRRRDNETGRADGQGGDQEQAKATDSPAITPELIEQQRADAQLAGALRAILGKLETGAWPKVGQSGADQLAKQHEREQLLRRRSQLQEVLVRIDEDLAKLGGTGEEIEQAADKNDTAPDAPADSP